jgi:hypothetical protein
MDCATALVIDLAVFAFCLAVLLWRGNLSHSHPATIYFVFHLFTFTTRLYSVMNGSPTLFATWVGNYDPIRDDEIVRASLLADMALLVMTCAWLLAARAHHRTQSRTIWSVQISPRVLWPVVAIAMPIGLYGLLTNAQVGGAVVVGAETDAASAYETFIQVWPGLMLLALIYRFGARWYYFLPLAAYLAIEATQGYHRFRLIIPIILLAQFWLERRGKRWPTPRIALALVACGIIFFPLKHIGTMVQSGESATAIISSSGEVLSQTVSGENSEHQLLDEFACVLSLVDDNGKYYYGQQYVALLALPVPRIWWPEKPAITDCIREFERPIRPMLEAGMVLTFLGEAYVNFGYVGIVVIPFLLAFSLARAHQRVLNLPYGSVGHFTYLLFACNLIQVYRDGLTSIVFFVFVHMAPLVMLAGIQLLTAKLQGPRQA